MELEERTVSFLMANLLANLVMIPLVAPIVLPFMLIHGTITLLDGFIDLFLPLWMFILVFVLSVFIHEGLHALGWMVLGKVGWHNMKFGIKQLTPYAHCKIPLSASAYRWGAALPAIVLGIIPGIVSLIAGSGWLAAYATLMLGAAAGDALMLWLLQDVPPDRRVQDHPEKVGCMLI